MYQFIVTLCNLRHIMQHHLAGRPSSARKHCILTFLGSSSVDEITMSAASQLDSHAPDSNAAAKETVQPALHLASCWACDTRVQVPLANGQPVLVFKVGPDR